MELLSAYFQQPYIFSVLTSLLYKVLDNSCWFFWMIKKILYCKSFQSDCSFAPSSPWLVLILRNIKGTYFSRTVTLMLFQTSDLVGSWAIFSAIFISSGRTEPNTVYAFFHSWWLARLIKNSGPEPTQATEPLLIVGQTSFGIFLNVVPWASNVPWIKAKGGPYGAWNFDKRSFWLRNVKNVK